MYDTATDTDVDGGTYLYDTASQQLGNSTALYDTLPGVVADDGGYMEHGGNDDDHETNYLSLHPDEEDGEPSGFGGDCGFGDDYAEPAPAAARGRTRSGSGSGRKKLGVAESLLIVTACLSALLVSPGVATSASPNGGGDVHPEMFLATTRIGRLATTSFDGSLADLYTFAFGAQHAPADADAVAQLLRMARLDPPDVRGHFAQGLVHAFDVEEPLDHALSLHEFVQGMQRLGWGRRAPAHCAGTPAAGLAQDAGFCPELPPPTQLCHHGKERRGRGSKSDGAHWPKLRPCPEATAVPARARSRRSGDCVKTEYASCLASLKAARDCDDCSDYCAACDATTDGCAFGAALTLFSAPQFSSLASTPPLVSTEFVPLLEAVNTLASECEVLIRVTGSFRPEASLKRSMGMAIRFQLETSSGLCDKQCLTLGQLADVACFQAKVAQHPGVMFDPSDPTELAATTLPSHPPFSTADLVYARNERCFDIHYMQGQTFLPEIVIVASSGGSSASASASTCPAPTDCAWHSACTPGLRYCEPEILSGRLLCEAVHSAGLSGPAAAFFETMMSCGRQLFWNLRLGTCDDLTAKLVAGQPDCLLTAGLCTADASTVTALSTVFGGDAAAWNNVCDLAARCPTNTVAPELISACGIDPSDPVGDDDDDGDDGSSCVSISITGSVGKGGDNNPTDVSVITTRLTELGYDCTAQSWVRRSWDSTNRKYFESATDKTYNDQFTGLNYCILLFQAVILGCSRIDPARCSGADGLVSVNGNSHRWLVAANAPRWINLDLDATDYEIADESWDAYHHGPHWTQDAVIKAGRKYGADYRADGAAKLSVNDVALVNGGGGSDAKYNEHRGHQAGHNFDARLPHKDGKLGGITYSDSRYDATAAEGMLRALWSTGNVASLLFNDATVCAKLNDDGDPLCKSSSGHDNHLHIDLKPPARTECTAPTRRVAHAVFPSGLKLTGVSVTPLGRHDVTEFTNPFAGKVDTLLFDACAGGDCAAQTGRQLSDSFKVGDFLAVADAGSAALNAVVGGKTHVRYFRLLPTLVECLQGVHDAAEEELGDTVTVVSAYRTKSVARALKLPTPSRSQSGAAAVVSFPASNTDVRLKLLAATVIDQCTDLAVEAGFALGLGLEQAGIHVDMRKLTEGNPLVAWSSHEGFTTEDFAAWALDYNDRRQRAVDGTFCYPDAEVPKPRDGSFHRDPGTTAAPDKGDSPFCVESFADRQAAFLKLWVVLEGFLASGEAAPGRSVSEFRGMMELCFMTCQSVGLFGAITNSPDPVREAACDNVLHWFPVGFGDTQDACHFYPRNSPMLKEAACFWGLCPDKTPLVGLLQGAMDTTWVDGTGEEQPLFHPSRNPSPMAKLYLRLLAMHCAGKVTLWADSPHELASLHDVLRALMAYNADVTEVTVAMTSPVHELPVVSMLENLATEWKTSSCRHVSRDSLPEFKVKVQDPAAT
eukprot:m.161350 g.161350  ORF g.161350 m.161350 type:complete len:1455 (+) comp17642_c0_seq1:5179-9543(+)